MQARLYFSLVVMFCLSIFSAFGASELIELKSNYQPSSLDIPLSSEELRWLARKSTLTVGTWLPEISPIDYESGGEHYQGVNADYLALLQKNLNIKIAIKQYDNEQEALAALSRNEVDTLLTQLSQRKNIGSDLLRTSALIKTWPTLVTSLKNTLLPLTTSKKVTLACVRNCSFLDVAKVAFPNAKITFYDSDYQAMSSVMTGQNQYFIGNNVTTANCISKYFSQSLVITHYFNKQQQYNYFVTSQNQPLLQSILEHFITSISNETHMRVMQNWLNRGNLAYLNKPIPFSPEEKSWLKKHPEIRVLINPNYPPFTLVDNDGELRGIMADLLNIIQLQTGLEFKPVIVNSNSEMTKKMAQGDWDMIPAATLSNEAQKFVSFSDPLMNVSFVIVTAHRETAATLQAKPMRIALATGSILAHDLKQRYPQASWVETNNVSVAMKMVEEGEVDAAVTSELSARYMIDHYYPQNMHYMRLPDMPAASISFAMSRDEPQLKSILSKALQAIPPRDILQMTEKWSKISSVQKDTWSLYSKQFYQLVIFALALIAISLGWGLSLSSEVRKRKQSQRQLEEQLQLKEALSHELEAEKDKAIQATKAKSRFLASMSHELRTPVSSIVGFLELLSSSDLNASQRKEAIALAGATAQSLLGLIGKILDVDKIESGKYQIAPQWTDLTQLTDLQCHSFDALAKQKGVALRCISELATNDRVLIDPQAWRQILTNLVGNALKFTDQGYIQVSAQLIRQDDKHGTLVVTVSDTGCGISPEEQETLFHRYVQARQGRKQTGSGLGLVICKELVTLMGGTLEMSSRQSQGTTFTITLAVETAKQLLTPTSDTPAALSPLPRLSILIADDNPTNRLLLKRQLNAIGYNVDEACDGEEAEAKIANKQYDLLITDVNMPKKDGLALAASLRQQHLRLQIWGLTASALSQSREQCLQSGMDKCLFKPVSIQTLTHELSKLDSDRSSPSVTRHLKLSILNENTGGDRKLMNEILETFREASANDLQMAYRSIEQDEPQMFLHALHRLHGSAQILEITVLQELCEPFESRRYDALPLEVRQEALEKIAAVMREIEVEIDSLISH
ncbi:transporter substrate-binding domain-containing protein [Buttiauxella sp. B2]|uniref:ATP-binding protein n=1 Tax=Buttiauxella sp. B2 TaxID=2587812 RepID=UPI00111F1BC3|nr:transporter substrate-binding domain-containing protein [Buttiauxella sp. B2]TNV14023.1 transporter substrate-binding domain-containing protein [Buttiauxella sp. B2]